jgi:hypothetical protein
MHEEIFCSLGNGEVEVLGCGFTMFRVAKMESSENELDFAPSGMGVWFLSTMAALGVVFAIISVRALILLNAYGVAPTPENNNATGIFGVTIGVFILTYCVNLLLCRVTITETEIIFKTLLRYRSLKLSEIRNVSGGYLFILGAPSYYTILTNEGKISINVSPFKKDQFMAIENRLFQASSLLRTHGRRRMSFPVLRKNASD